MCAGSTDRREWHFSTSTEIKTKHNHNTEHEVTNCSFLTAKYLKCGCFAECLFTWIIYMIEPISDINQFKAGRWETCPESVGFPMKIVRFCPNQPVV